MLDSFAPRAWVEKPLAKDVEEWEEVVELVAMEGSLGLGVGSALMSVRAAGVVKRQT